MHIILCIVCTCIFCTVDGDVSIGGVQHHMVVEIYISVGIQYDRISGWTRQRIRQTSEQLVCLRCWAAITQLWHGSHQITFVLSLDLYKLKTNILHTCVHTCSSDKVRSPAETLCKYCAAIWINYSMLNGASHLEPIYNKFDWFSSTQYSLCPSVLGGGMWPGIPLTGSSSPQNHHSAKMERGEVV